MRLRSLQQRLDPTTAAEVDTAIDELEVTVTELRRLAHGVRPSRLDDGLGPALEGLLATSPIPVDLHVETLPHTDEARTLTAYLVASEAVTNALKHSRARRIGVRLGSQGYRVTVQVSDDGVGGIPEDGLTALRDRVISVGGSLQVDSPVGGGTTVSAVV